MKREELMINDIVFDYTNSPVKVCAVGQDIVVKNSFGIGSLEPNELSPIPLTEEILVKNGFEKFAESQANFDYTDNDIHLEYWIGDGCFRYYTAEIRYVHQLQHLLRLCGIEKELVID